MVDPLSYFSFQPVIPNKGHGMCYPVCGMMHIKEPLLLIGKSSPCSGGSGVFNGSLPYVQSHIAVNKNMLGVSLNISFLSSSRKASHSYSLILIRICLEEQ